MGSPPYPKRLLSGFVPGLSWPGTRPLRVMLDTTNRCNIRCVMCHFAYPAAWEQQLERWTDEFLAIVEREVFPFTCQAQLSLGTEPLVWKEFPDLLDACKRAGVPFVEMYTNGLLITPELAEKIVATPMSRVQLSLEGATKEGYESVRVGGSFERFQRGVRMLDEAKRRAGSEVPVLQFNVTMLRRNAHEMEGILRLAKELGVSDLDFRHVIIHDGLGMETESFLNDKTGFNALMRRLRALADELGLAIVVQPKDFDLGEEEEAPVRPDQRNQTAHILARAATAPPVEYFPAPPPPSVEGHGCPECWAPWRQILIRSDGSVVPCPFWYTDDTMGNLQRQGFMEVWEGEPFKKLRHGLLTRDYHVNCAKCPLRGIGKVDDDRAHRSHNLDKGQFRSGTGLEPATGTSPDPRLADGPA